MKRVSKGVFVAGLLCVITLLLSSCDMSDSLESFKGQRLESKSPQMYIDMIGDRWTGEMIDENGVKEKIELGAMHGSCGFYKFREVYTVDDVPFFFGNYRVEGDAIVIEDGNGNVIRLEKTNKADVSSTTLQQHRNTGDGSLC